MKLEVDDQDDEVLKVTLEDANEAVANTLRRAIITEVPTLAVDHVEISSNESGLFDEMLAHRIGQVPFTVPGNVEEGDKVHVALKREGPGDVLASDIKTDNEEADPVNPDSIIATLKDGQEIELEGEATIGKGDEHAKHQGGTVGYQKVDDTTFKFRIESTSGYDNEELFNRALEEVKAQLTEFEEEVEDL